MSDHLTTSPSYLIGRWQLVPAATCLRCAGRERRLTPQQLRLLLAFVDAPEHCLSKAAMIDRVWDGRVVTDDALARAIAELRKQLTSDDGVEYIQTLHGHGYRLNVAVQRLDQQPASISLWRWAALGGLLLAGLASWYGLSTGGSTRAAQQPLALRAEPLHSDLPAERNYVAIAPAGTLLWHQRRDEQSTLFLDQGGQQRLLWQAPGRMSGVRGSPLGTRVAFVHRDQRCSLIGVDLASGDLHRWASCSTDGAPAIGWRDEQTLLSARRSSSAELEIATLSWPGSPQVRRVPAADCELPLQIAQTADRPPLLSCRSERGAVLYRVGEAALEEVLVYRSIRLWVEDGQSRIYLASAPAWQPGITRFDPAKGDFAYAQTGWIADLAKDGEQLIAIRDQRNLDLLALDLDTLGQSVIENNQRMTRAFTVDPGTGTLWRLDDRAGDLAIHSGDRARLRAAQSEVNLAQVVAMAVDEGAGWLILTTLNADRYQHHWLTLNPISRLAIFDAGSAALRIDGGRANYLDPTLRPAAFDLASGVAAGPVEADLPAEAEHCPGSPLRSNGWHIEIIAEADGALFRERDPDSGEIRRRWRDTRIQTRCGLIQPRLDAHGRRLIYGHLRDAGKDLIRIEVGS